MKDDLTLIISAVRYIEEHLREKLSLEDIAHEVGFSKYYFTKLFTRYTGQSPYDYYRGRKLTETIQYIKDNNCKIIDAAYEYGFSSPEVFARACAAVFGKSPSAIKKEMAEGTFVGVTPISEGYLWFTNRYDQEPELNLMDGLNLVGIGFFSDRLDESLYQMPLDQLRSMGHSNEGQTFKITWLDHQPMGYMNFIGHPVSESNEDSILLSKKLPKMAYLVFDYMIQKEEIAYFFKYVYEQWLPGSGYELLIPMHLEVLSGSDQGRQSKLYIPVVPV